MSNKLAVSTLAFQNWELEDAINACKKYGIEAMEIRMGFHSWSKLELPDYVYKQNYEKIHSHGIVVSDLGTSVHMIDCNEDALKEVERCSQIANILHCKGLRIMFGSKRKFWSESPTKIDYDELVNWLVKADHIVERYQTQIWLETHDEFSTGKIQREVLERYPFRNIRLLWDIMHSLEAKEDHEETLKYMGTDLVHVHIKDGIPGENPDCIHWKYTRLGEGIVPIHDIVDQILQSGYKGYFSLEWESAWREELRGNGYEIPKMLERYTQLMQEILKNRGETWK